METFVKTPTELYMEAARFVNGIAPKEKGAILITLSGELGAGKTAFTKAVARALGIDETVNSPTFVLEKIYQLKDGTSKFKRLVHIDAYRLDSGNDLIALGFDELMEDAGNFILFEWPEKVADVLPVPDVKIYFAVNTDGSRSISYV